MGNDNVVSLAAPAAVSDPLTDLLRAGARRLIEAAVSAEFGEYLSAFEEEKLPDGRRQMVRNGHLPERQILTGIGAVDVRVPKARSRSGSALSEVYPETRSQRCWMHKSGNVLNYFPKSGQAKAKQGLQEIWMAETRAQAERAFDDWIERYEDKYPKATACLARDREELLAFYDFPAVHWTHLRTTNVIESAFAVPRQSR